MDADGLTRVVVAPAAARAHPTLLLRPFGRFGLLWLPSIRNIVIVTATSAAKMSGQSDMAAAAAIAERVLCAKMGRPPFAPFPLTIAGIRAKEGYVTVRAAVKFADGRKCPPGSS